MLRQLERDPQLVTRAPRAPSWFAGALGAASVLLLTAGCGAAPSDERPAPAEPAPVVTRLAAPPVDLDYLTEGAAVDEYRAALTEITEPLPEGLDYPPGLPSDFLPRDGYLESGAARNQAYFTWLCAWEGDYLAADQSKDSARLADAASKLELWATGSFYNDSVIDPDHGWVTNVLGPMRLGDPSGVVADYRQLCAGFPTVAAGATR